MGLLDVFVTASIPVLKVLVLTGVGCVLALDRINILGEDARKHLNNVTFYVFSPAIVWSSLAKTITLDSLANVWFMPINILLTFVVGSVLGWLLVRLTTTPPNLRGLVIGCCAGGNLGNLMLILVPAICKEKGSPFGDTELCKTYGLAYVSLSMAIGMIYIWSYLYNIVRVSSSKAPTSEYNSNDMDSHSVKNSISHEEGSSKTPLLLSPNELPTAMPDEKLQVTFAENIKQGVGKLLRRMNIKRLLAPSIVGAMIGFMVGLVPLIRKSMIGDTAPLRVIQDSVVILGDGAIPSLTLVMGGNLLRGLKGSGIKKSVIVGILAVRYIMLPVIGIPIVKAAIHLGLVHSDPLYQFVLFLQYALPPALSIGTITQLFGAGQSECSVIMLWAYALASVALTLWSTFFMWLVAH